MRLSRMKKVFRRLAILVALVLVVLAIRFTKPWDDLQSWRWFTQIFESTRSELFRHWEVIQPVAKLAASSHPRTYVRNTVDPAAVNYEFEGKRYPLTHYLQRAKISGFMVLANGEVRLEYYAGDFNQESRNHVWSATKSFTSTLIGMAVHDGTLASLDDPVEKYAPRFAGTEYGPTSIRHVMMMSSGIDFFHF